MIHASMLPASESVQVRSIRYDLFNSHLISNYNTYGAILFIFPDCRLG